MDQYVHRLQHTAPDVYLPAPRYRFQGGCAMKKLDNGTGCGKIILTFILLIVLAIMARR
jgi:hypothetical protein